MGNRVLECKKVAFKHSEDVQKVFHQDAPSWGQLVQPFRVVLIFKLKHGWKTEFDG